MAPVELFQQYRAEHRGRPCPGYSVEVFPDLSRGTAIAAGDEGWIGFANLDPATADERIDEQMRYFERIGQPFEWKVYDFDTPASLKEQLEARGFGCNEPEAFLAMAIDAWPESNGCAPNLRIEKLGDDEGIKTFVAVEEAVWEESFPSHLARYTRELNAAPDVTSFYCAYLIDRPVAVGRISLPAGSAFAGLWGGCVLRAMRGHRVYSAMLDCRIREAKARGYRFVTIDAEPMSRPILLRKGFQHICWTYPMRRKLEVPVTAV